MRIAIPIVENKGKDSEIAQHFGHVRFIVVYDSNKDKLNVMDVKNVEGCSPVATIENENIDVIYCFGMGMRAIELCKQKGIKLKTGPFTTIKQVIENLDKLEDLEESCGH